MPSGRFVIRQSGTQRERHGVVLIILVIILIIIVVVGAPSCSACQQAPGPASQG